MAQSSDQTVQNATFPAVRADINDNLAALFSQSSGASAPATTVAFQPWIDTSTNPATWRIRDGDNGDWIVIGTLDATFNAFAVGGLTAIANGGTGQTTASGAINALVPSQTGNASKALVTDGSVVSWGSLTNSQVFYYTTVGATTWTKPSTGVVALVTIWGGGGGGGRNSGGSAGGGGGGACVQRLYQLADLPSTVTVTVGAGGLGGVSSSSNGAAGGTTTFGALLSAFGGGGGGIDEGGGGGGSASAGAQGSAGGAGGAGGGTLFEGGDATAGGAAFGGAAGGTGTGGSSGWGGGGGGSTGGTSINGGAGGGTSVAGLVPGGGGGRGSGAAAGNGGAGAALIVVW